MTYCVVDDAGVIKNIIVCGDDATAHIFRARPAYDGAAIGDLYVQPPEPDPEHTPAKQRENAYNTQAVIPWDGEMLTVTEASQKWQYYAAEGDTAKTDELTAMIAEAKASIREQYPDEEGGT